LFLLPFFVEDGLLNCINCIQFPSETGNHPHDALLNSGLTSADSGLQLALGDRAKRCLSEDRARAEDALKLSDDEIKESFTSSATVCLSGTLPDFFNKIHLEL
jgi:hypothetical protein